jgi:hypothetical protein
VSLTVGRGKAVPYGTVKAPAKKKKRKRNMRFDETTDATVRTPRQMAEVRATKQVAKRMPRKVVKALPVTARNRKQAATKAARTTARGGY